MRRADRTLHLSKRTWDALALIEEWYSGDDEHPNIEDPEWRKKEKWYIKRNHETPQRIATDGILRAFRKAGRRETP